VFTFLYRSWESLRGAPPTPFMAFFVYVWLLWTAKALLARRYRPFTGRAVARTSTVIVPVYNESAELFEGCLASIRANEPTELIAVVDGGDADLATIAGNYCDRVLRVPKAGKRAAIASGLAAADATTDVVVVVDSDTLWTPGTLEQMLLPFDDERVGGVTPRQAIFGAEGGGSRRLAAWIEDLRYHLTVPAQSVAGQVGCLAGRTIAYRREAFEPAVERLVQQRVLGVPIEVGDDRVLTSELLRNGWRTQYQSSALVLTDAPSDWRGFWQQQLRWGRSSQRETLLTLRWLWRRPAAFVCFASDIVMPFALYGVIAISVARGLNGAGAGTHGMPVAPELLLAYPGMLASIGIRQIGHFRRSPGDLLRLPVFVLQLTFVMVPIRIVAFATMLHQGWGTRATPVTGGIRETACAESAHG
jgi:cellulose synthase/poly-beta-1,6-N-acetylglucosamine synthase-like glycosyltransferase